MHGRDVLAGRHPALTTHALVPHRRSACRLLRAGARADDEDARALTPLCVAALTGNVRVCELLLRQGAAVDRPCRGAGACVRKGAR